MTSNLQLYLLLLVSLSVCIHGCNYNDKHTDQFPGRIVIDENADVSVLLHHIEHHREGNHPLPNAVIQCFADEKMKIELPELKTSTDNNGYFKLIIKPDTVDKFPTNAVYIAVKNNHGTIFLVIG